MGRGAGGTEGGWGLTEGGGQVGGGAAALQIQTPERAASTDPGARTAPRRGRDFRQDCQLEQATQGGPGEHQGARSQRRMSHGDWAPLRWAMC